MIIGARTGAWAGSGGPTPPSIWRYDGKMHFWYSLNESNFNGGVVSFNLGTVTGSATVDWGDGTSSTMTTGRASHTFAAIGDYEIVVAGFTQVLLGDECFGLQNSQIVRIEMGSPFSLRSGIWTSFSQLQKLISVNLNGYSSLCSQSCFMSSTELTDIVDARFVSVGKDSFRGCYSLTTIDLSLCQSIDVRGFYYCSQLTSINLSSCTTVGVAAFIGTPITSITSTKTHTEMEGISGFDNLPSGQSCIYHCSDGDFYRSGSSLLPVA